MDAAWIAVIVVSACLSLSVFLFRAIWTRRESLRWERQLFPHHPPGEPRAEPLEMAGSRTAEVSELTGEPRAEVFEMTADPGPVRGTEGDLRRPEPVMRRACRDEGCGR